MGWVLWIPFHTWGHWGLESQCLAPNAHWEEGQARIQTQDPCAPSCLSVRIYFPITKEISVRTLRMATGLRSEEQMDRKLSGTTKEAQDHLNLEKRGLWASEGRELACVSRGGGKICVAEGCGRSGHRAHSGAFPSIPQAGLSKGPLPLHMGQGHTWHTGRAWQRAAQV